MPFAILSVYINLVLSFAASPRPPTSLSHSLNIGRCTVHLWETYSLSKQIALMMANFHLPCIYNLVRVINHGSGVCRHHPSMHMYIIIPIYTPFKIIPIAFIVSIFRSFIFFSSFFCTARSQCCSMSHHAMPHAKSANKKLVGRLFAVLESTCNKTHDSALEIYVRLFRYQKVKYLLCK